MFTLSTTIALLVFAMQAEPIFESDFESEQSLQQFDAVSHKDRITLAIDPTDESNQVVRVDMLEGGHYGGSIHVDLANHMADGQEPTRAYFRYRLYFDESWTGHIGGKLPGFGGTYNIAGWGGQPSDGTNGWSARGMYGRIDEDGGVPIGSYVYYADMVDEGRTYGKGMWWDASLEHGRWYTIEQEIQLNSVSDDDPGTGSVDEGQKPGKSDGWLKAWVDGKLVFDQQGLHLRDVESLKIERIWFNIYEGGKTPAASDMFLLMDDVSVSDRRDSENGSGDDSEDGSNAGS